MRCSWGPSIDLQALRAAARGLACIQAGPTLLVWVCIPVGFDLISRRITQWSADRVDDITQGLWSSAGLSLSNTLFPSGAVCCMCVPVLVPLHCPARTVKGLEGRGTQAEWLIWPSLLCSIPFVLSLFDLMWPLWGNWSMFSEEWPAGAVLMEDFWALKCLCSGTL